MAVSKNPQKNYRWILSIDGIDVAQIQKITIPTVSVGIATHRGGVESPNRKSPTKANIGEMTLEKTLPINRADYDIWDWFTAAQIDDGPLSYRTGVITEVGPLRTPLRVFEFTDAWVSAIDLADLEGNTDGDNLIETATIQMHTFTPENRTLLRSLWQV